jgi:6,7-dimethyl-8-ribityllumazine synthase
LATVATSVYTQIEHHCTHDLRIDSQNHDQPALSAKDFRFAIVASRWNNSIVSRLIDGAFEALREAAVPDQAIEVYRVPGSFEIALCALKAAASRKFDAVICLGVIIRGETPHFDFIAREAARGISEAGLETGVPVLFGVITAENIDQANARAGARQDNKGYEAALAAVEVVNLYRDAFGSNSA